MLEIFANIKKNVNLKPTPVTIDNTVFKLHYRFTFAILMMACLMVTATQYIGEHIKCITSEADDKLQSVKLKVINTFCFCTSTFTVVKHLNSSILDSGLIPHPGVGPLPFNSKDEVIRHNYYQWVAYVLFFQAITFYIPHYIWKKKEDNRIKTLVIGLKLATLALHEKEYVLKDGTIPSRSKRQEDLQRIKQAFMSQAHNSPWSFWLVTCEVLNFINVLVNIYFTNMFLGGNFYSLGSEFLKQDIDGQSVDILDYVFPKVTKCTFHKYGPTGTIQNYDAMCVMALNIVNDKIYVILWFWFLMLVIVSFLGLLWRLATYLLHSKSARFNHLVFSLAFPGKLNPWNVLTVTKDCHFADWLFLYYLSKSMDGLVFRDLFISLANDLDKKANRYIPSMYDSNGSDQVDLIKKKPDEDILPEKLNGGDQMDFVDEKANEDALPENGLNDGDSGKSIEMQLLPKKTV